MNKRTILNFFHILSLKGIWSTRAQAIYLFIGNLKNVGNNSNKEYGPCKDRILIIIFVVFLIFRKKNTNKIEKNENYIKCTFYELRVKRTLSEEQVDELLKLAKTRLENMNYQVYFTGAKFKYNGKEQQVQSQDYMIAIKERNIK